MKRFLGLTLIIILFCGCTGNKNTYYQYYKHANKIASTINFELNSLDENVDLRSLLIYYDKYKKDLENTDFTKPVKGTLLIYKYTEQGPLPYYAPEYEILPELLKRERKKEAEKSVTDFLYRLNLKDDETAMSYYLFHYELFVDKNLYKQPVIFILEYENSYPIVVSFFTGEDNAIFEKGTVIFDKNLKSEDITSALIWSNLELDKEIVQTLN